MTKRSGYVNLLCDSGCKRLKLSVYFDSFKIFSLTNFIGREVSTSGRQRSIPLCFVFYTSVNLFAFDGTESINF